MAKTALFSFSTFPLVFFYVVAGLSFAAGLAVAGFVLFHKFFTGLAVPGWASLSIAVCFFGALNAMGIAILGEYVSRIYDQVLRPAGVYRPPGSERRGQGEDLRGREKSGLAAGRNKSTRNASPTRKQGTAQSCLRPIIPLTFEKIVDKIAELDAESAEVL